MKEEINRTSLGKDVERFCISVLWLLNALRWCLPAWRAVWPVGPEDAGPQRGSRLRRPPPCCSLAGAGLRCRGVSWLPSLRVPCSSVCPDGVHSWWAWRPGAPSTWSGPATLSANLAPLLLLGLLTSLRWTGLDHLPRATPSLILLFPNLCTLSTSLPSSRGTPPG